MDLHSGDSRTVSMLSAERAGARPRAKESEPSMSPSLRRIGAALGVAGALAAAAIGCGGSTEGTAAATQQRGPDLSALATKLGVSESELGSAMQAARPCPAARSPASAARPASRTRAWTR